MAQDAILKEIRPPWGPQLDFLKSGATFRRYQGGQGSGKTLAGVFEVRRYVKLHPGAIFLCTEPTFPLVRDTLLVEFQRQFEAAGEASWAQYKAAETKFICGNGSEIWLRQSDKPDALRGPTVAAVWMDEAAQTQYASFQILTGRMRQTGYPHLFIATGTPRGKNWLHWVFTPGDRPEGAPGYIGDPEHGITAESFFANSTDNPHLDAITKAALLRAYPPGSLLHRQEVRGEAVVFEGLIYTAFEPERHVQSAPEPENFVAFSGACDWGWTNPGVFLLGGLHRNGSLWILREWFETQRSLEWWGTVIRQQHEKTRLQFVECDPSEPGNIDYLKRLGLPAHPAENAVIPGITAVSSAFSEGRLFIAPECTNLIRELQAQCWKRTRDNAIRRDEPEKIDDHANDALRYWVMRQVSRPSIASRPVFVARG